MFIPDKNNTNFSDFAGNPGREGQIAQVIGHGPANTRDAEHMLSLVEAALPDCKGLSLRLHSHMPPFDRQRTPDGFVELFLHDDSGDVAAFSIKFGGRNCTEVFGFFEHEPDGQLMREAAHEGDPINAMASVDSFDTFWLFLCIFIERMQVKGVKFSYGV